MPAFSVMSCGVVASFGSGLRGSCLLLPDVMAASMILFSSAYTKSVVTALLSCAFVSIVGFVAWAMASLR